MRKEHHMIYVLAVIIDEADEDFLGADIDEVAESINHLMPRGYDINVRPLSEIVSC